jgi:Tfp pilus assembly protein PilF
VHNNLGTLMSVPEQAESHFLEAIRHSPNHVNAHYNLGQIYRSVDSPTVAYVIYLPACTEKQFISEHCK